MKTIRDFNFKNKRVLVRCDFNVPLDENGEILDDFRIRQAVSTVQYLISEEAKVILMSHLGDPKGEVVEKLKLTPVQEKLIEYLDLSVTKAPDCIGKNILKWTREMLAGEILLLENLRFHKEEEENNFNFAEKIAQLGDIFINDGFGVCHRDHASVTGIPKILDSGIGFLVEKETQNLNKIIQSPEKPLIAVIGGKKVEDKAKVIDKISEFADYVLIGHLIEKELSEKKINLKYPSKILGPADGILEDGSFFDIGEKTVKLFSEKIMKAKTIFWSGVLGKIEEERFTNGSKKIAEAIVESGAFSVAGGGDTIEFLNKIKVSDKFNHISTGGGAMLIYLADETLVGLEAIKFKNTKHNANPRI